MPSPFLLSCLLPGLVGCAGYGSGSSGAGHRGHKTFPYDLTGGTSPLDGMGIGHTPPLCSLPWELGNKHKKSMKWELDMNKAYYVGTVL